MTANDLCSPKNLPLSLVLSKALVCLFKGIFTATRISISKNALQTLEKLCGFAKPPNDLVTASDRELLHLRNVLPQHFMLEACIVL